MASQLQIPLEDLHEPRWRPLYVGDRARYATATSVRLLDSHTLVCCSLLARVIYLVRFDLAAGSFEVLDRTATTYDGVSTETDLCDIDGLGNVVTSNCELGTLSLYRREADSVRHARDLPTGLTGNFCHGARFLTPNLVAATALRDPARGVHVFDLPTMRRHLFIATDRLPKDVCFAARSSASWQAVVITTAGAPLPTATTPAPQVHASELLRVELDLDRGTHRVVDREPCPAGQVDAIATHRDRLFVTDSPGGRILVMAADTLRQVDEIDGLSFPHGVDVNYGMLAVACYGTNAIHLRALP